MANNTSTQKLVNELETAVDEAKKLLKVFDETEKVTKEIAEELNITVSTSKSQFSRARVFLQKKLKGQEII